MRYQTKRKLVDIYEFNAESVDQIRTALEVHGWGFNYGIEPEGIWAEIWCLGDSSDSSGHWQRVNIGDRVIITQSAEVIVADESYVKDLYEPYKAAQTLSGPLQGEWTT